LSCVFHRAKATLLTSRTKIEIPAIQGFPKKTLALGIGFCDGRPRHMETERASGRSPNLPSFVRYFVASGNAGGWLVFKEGLPRPVQKAAQKLQAVETAKIMARDEAPSQVLVERADGSFFEQYAFGQSY
jgi:Uncharacterized protein conserved in bacteria (DUF2188)